MIWVRAVFHSAELVEGLCCIISVLGYPGKHSSHFTALVPIWQILGLLCGHLHATVCRSLSVPGSVLFNI